MDVEHLLYECCTELGYCLSPEDRQQLAEEPPLDVDSFVRAILEAEKLDADLIALAQRDELRTLVARHFSSDSY